MNNKKQQKAYGNEAFFILHKSRIYLQNQQLQKIIITQKLHFLHFEFFVENEIIIL